MAAIFVLHRDKLVLELMGAVLRDHGHRVVAALDTHTGASMIAAAPCDLAILDLDSSKDGFAGLSQLKEHSCRKDLGVLIIAPAAHPEEIKAAAALGARGYLVTAQFTVDSFLKHVEKALPGHGTPARPARSAPTPVTPTAVMAPAVQAAAEHSPIGSGSSLPDKPVAELLRAIKPIIGSTQLKEKLKVAYELKALSPTVARVLDLTRSATVSVDSVVNAIKCDQAIALRVIKLANSAIYQRGDRVNTVKAAVLRIGMQQIQLAVGNIGVVDRFSSVSMEKHLNHVLFWEHCLGTGIIAAQLAAATKITDTDNAFTMGLLHDVGRMLLAEAIPEEYLRVLNKSEEDALPLEQVEKRMLTTTHAEIMQDVLRAWNFPRVFIDPVSCHQSSAGTLREACPSQLNEAALLALSNRLAHAMFLGCSGSKHVAGVKDLCDLLRVPNEVIQKIIENAESQTQDLKLAMLSTATNADLTTKAQQVRAEFHGPFRPLFINGGQKPDALQIMCKHLADAGAEGPTVAVVHLHTAREKATVGGALLNAERAAKQGQLPMIVISPNGQWTLDDSFASRQAVLLPEPVSTTRFAAAVRSLQAGVARMAA